MKRLFSLLLVCLLMLSFLYSCGFTEDDKDDNVKVMKEQWIAAEKTPFGKYPETVTYTLGKEISTNNSNMPEEDTYENNAYTRYLLEKLNVQNENVFEGMDDEYNTAVSMAIAMGDIPDIMVVNNYNDVLRMVEMGLIADLTESYENCASASIKAMYESYGDELLDSVTFDGKIMAIPETNIEEGPNLIWLRKDWMDELGLDEPKTLEDVEYIISKFLEADSQRVGLVITSFLCGESGYSSQYITDIIFANFGAYPKQWIENDEGEIVYGSVQPEAKAALEHIHQLYKAGIIDRDFLFRTTNDIIELIESGRCGSFFGPWWSPNNPLMKMVENNPEADWQPYLISTGDDGVTRYHSTNPTNYKYVVVRKDFEHPEIAWKIISILFDYARYQDKEGASEVDEYDKNAVDPTARPLVINVDYSNALSLCYENIQAVFEGKKELDDLNSIEKSYAEQCMNYLNSGNGDKAEQWAAYTSRITACSLISQDNVEEVKSYFFSGTPTMDTGWWQLKEIENNAYLRIVTGQADISYFDTFVEEWEKKGGLTITREVNKCLNENED